MLATGRPSRMSLPRITTCPSQEGPIAARMPSGMPITAATPTATSPTYKVVREPTRIWVKTSRRSLSVPSQCSAFGVWKAGVLSTFIGG